MTRQSLPIDPILPVALQSLRENPSLVLQAPPGAGKTTRLPPALLGQSWLTEKQVVVLQPRRLPTRLAAKRVAAELGESLGETVGYQIRLEDRSGPRTRLRYVTEGILTRQLLIEPRLPAVGAVVLDEFHERHIAADLSLALLRQLQRESRPELRLIVMSATLDIGPIAAYLGNCPTLRSEGKAFPVDVEFLPRPDDRPVEALVLAALKKLIANKHTGDILCFLPGAAEIRRSRETCADYADSRGLSVAALHGDLPSAEQDRAIAPGPRQKLILSTNVAETSVTIEGVTAVIDSGLARSASHSAWSGLPMLRLSKISKSSAIQRSGRAGRLQPGKCLRLYTRHDFESRPDYDTPEIQRLDLAEPVLSLKALGTVAVESFPFFESPKKTAIEAAEVLLRRLEATDAEGAITPTGRRMIRLPVHPRLARLIVEGERRGVALEAADCAALLSERDIRLQSRASMAEKRAGTLTGSSRSDVLDLLEWFREARQAKFDPAQLKRLQLDARACREADQTSSRLARGLTQPSAPTASTKAKEDALLLSVLKGFPDRVAKRRAPKTMELLLCGGGTATLSESSSVRDSELLVAVDAEERAAGKTSGAIVRIASQVEPEWLLDSGADLLTETDQIAWNANAEKVERLVRLNYGSLIIEETSAPAPVSDKSTQVLIDALRARGSNDLIEAEAVEAWLARLELVARLRPAENFPAPNAAFERAFTEWSKEARSIRELRDRPFLAVLNQMLTPKQASMFARLAPERLALRSRQVPVHYERGREPWIQSRLQDFFGATQGPRIGDGQVPLVLHLLAPNQRAVQVTTDLAGFWERHYPPIRKELMRKYPRHAWPENPLAASPPSRHR